VPVVIAFGAEAATILKSLPASGSLFPRIIRTGANHRAKTFIRRLKTLGIIEISLQVIDTPGLNALKR